MKVFYSIKSEFCEFLKNQQNISAFYDSLDMYQKQLIFEAIDCDALLKSSEAYFQDSIYKKNDTLFYEHKVLRITFRIACFSNHICFDNENNPFFMLLQRKYRYYRIEDMK